MDQKSYSSKKRLSFLQAAAICGVVLILLEVFKSPELDKQIKKFG